MTIIILCRSRFGPALGSRHRSMIAVILVSNNIIKNTDQFTRFILHNFIMPHRLLEQSYLRNSIVVEILIILFFLSLSHVYTTGFVENTGKKWGKNIFKRWKHHCEIKKGTQICEVRRLMRFPNISPIFPETYLIILNFVWLWKRTHCWIAIL